ncbi:hypothetical protein [Sinomicrobium sp. M5D2P17]
MQAVLLWYVVTLRIWLPLLEMLLGNFPDAYRIVAWPAWVPNLIVAYFIVKNKSAVKNDLRFKEKVKIQR